MNARRFLIAIPLTLTLFLMACPPSPHPTPPTPYGAQPTIEKTVVASLDQNGR
jgi:hypothetical protein